MRAVRIAVAFAVVAMAGLAQVQARQDKDAKDVTDAIAALKGADPAVAKLFTSAYGYAVFPKITKAAVVVGGAAGDGRVFEKNAYIGDVHVSQATIGASLGGQSFSEVIFFENKAALDKFKQGGYEMSAGMSAVAAGEGKSSDAKYTDGVEIITLAKKGLMADVSVGGQKFKFTPKK
jgi:lipid-binding SYLF domain-containing protein